MAVSRSLGAAIAAAVVNIGFLHAAHAAEADPQAGSAAPAEDRMTELEGVTVLGSRRYDRSSDTETAVPVDMLPMQKAAEQGGNFDLAQTLQYTAPSFISGHQTGADNADSVDSAALRGLGSDQTLVLVNGKRLHSTALVNLFGARNRGNTGTDLNTIPLLAIDHVEILRDGAAAQYGSDAIAGVMNIALKRRKGCEGVVGYGEYSRGDGENWLASAYCGFQVGNDGVVALTGEYLDRGRSNRSGPDNPRTIGDTAVENGTVYFNGDIPFGNGMHFYFDGGLQNRSASSGAFARGGIGSDDIPSRNSEAMYPDGFVPFIDPYVQDRHGTAGVWWNWNDWRVDASQTLGYNKLIDTIRHTLNASIANYDLEHGGAGISPDHFNAGGFSFTQATTNLDFTRFFDGWLHGVNVAFGGEFRHENYEIYAGEPGSYIDADGPGGGNAGSQGFPGFQPADAADKSRHSWAGYVDVETNWTDRFMTDQALRYEDYSDFGSTTTGKIAAAFRVTDQFLLRASASTGFRAPSLQQRWFSSTFTDFISGEPVDVVLAPNGGPIARAAGIPNLKEETSQSVTAGFTWKPTDALSITLDGYRIDIDDRIVLTGYFDTSDPDIGEILQQLGVGSAQFFVNSVDTRTQGLDLTVSHGMDLGQGRLESFLAFNHGTTKVRKVHTPPSLVGREDSLLGERDRLFIEGGAPRSKATLGFDYSIGDWDANLKFIHFGRMTLGTFSGPPVPNQHYGAATSADASLTYSFSENTKLTVGGTNIFDKFPTSQNPDETDNGFKYEAVQFGLNGAAWFVRLAHRF
ncbi:TonB-dependent receptor plug domain-containing protein [Dokdonella fugitiva]|uniref:Iron complex outermembrane receptor protein n=1 Tax=Dokdonella fugitiva TaxID=328517 RepID=A0A4R2I1D5_9GAMM|nr:TonB-dependent receptor [Dokdonella fugitiva]TCO37289.1 iron complex outermembrane receptor protein [Dokdonella fugitiva]